MPPTHDSVTRHILKCYVHFSLQCEDRFGFFSLNSISLNRTFSKTSYFFWAINNSANTRIINEKDNNAVYTNCTQSDLFNKCIVPSAILPLIKRTRYAKVLFYAFWIHYNTLSCGQKLYKYSRYQSNVAKYFRRNHIFKIVVICISSWETILIIFVNVWYISSGLVYTFTNLFVSSNIFCRFKSLRNHTNLDSLHLLASTHIIRIR